MSVFSYYYNIAILIYFTFKYVRLCHKWYTLFSQMSVLHRCDAKLLHYAATGCEIKLLKKCFILIL